MTKKLSEILPKDFIKIEGSPDVDVTGFSSDSREIQPGYVFFAIRGEHSDGNRFIPSAISKGAVAVVSETPCLDHLGSVFIQAQDIYQFMAEISASFYGTAYTDLKVIGVTGTNGKTTTAFFINELLKSFGEKTIFIGTIGIEICGEKSHTDYTTPPAYEIHRIIKEGLDRRAAFLVMEVSSHALKFKRVWGMQFDVAIFTNLTHEHREIHPTMEDYFETKHQLFSMLKNDGIGIINADDPYGQKMLSQSNKANLIDYGYNAKNIKLISCTSSQDQSQSIRYETQGSAFELRIPMVGSYNAYNALTGAEALSILGFERQRIRENFMFIPPVPGRLEWIEINEIRVLIDFAHTPDGLEKLIQTVRELRNDNARIITVFGCPGSRDPSKRPMMGRIATELSDHVIVTTDDIHHEKPDDIIRDIVNGISKTNYEEIVDRREAIARGLELSNKGDFLIVAGRGHEKFQYVGDQKVPFQDQTVVLEEAEKAGKKLQK